MYYRLYDTQTGDYMATAYNAVSLLDVAEQYISYKSVDTDEDSLWEDICHHGIERTLGNDEFILEKSMSKFEEI